LRDTLPLLNERVAKRRYMTERGYSSKLQQLELEELQLTRERDVGVQSQSAERYAAATSAIDAQIRNLRQQFIKDASTMLAKAQSEIALRTSELAKATQKSQLQRLTSPIDGTVQQLSIHTVGAVVKPADPILVVVPIGGTMIIEAQVLNRDVGQLRIGQPVAIKLEAFSFTRYGTIPGHLVDLSKDAVQDEKRGLIYQARITIDCDSRKDRQKVIKTQQTSGNVCAKAAPGMATTADIKTGTRSIISFLLSPIQRRLAEAGREE
jgi:hemolysin D